MAMLLFRGLESRLPILADGSIAWTTDTNKIFIGSTSGNIKVYPVEGSGENIDIVESSNNGKFVVNGIEIDVFDDSEIRELLTSKASAEDIMQVNTLLSDKADNSQVLTLQTEVENKANTSELISLQTVLENKADRSDLPNPSSLETLSKLSDNGTELLFNGVSVGGVGEGYSIPEFIIKESWNTSGSKTFGTAMTKLYINNNGSSDLTFTINNITTTVRVDETMIEIFDPFTHILISATGLFYAEVSALKSGSSNPLYSTKDSFEGLTNITRNFTGSCYGLIISNDGEDSFTYSINGIVMEIDAGDVIERSFEAFTQLSVVSNVPYRVLVKSAYLTDITGSTLDLTPPVLSASISGGLFNTAQTIQLTSNEESVIYYTVDGSTPNINSAIYTIPIVINLTSTLKFYGIDTAGNASEIQSEIYTIDTVLPIVTISPIAGTYSSSQTVLLTASEDAIIYYTLDGTTPTLNSSVYGVPIPINSTRTIKYFAKDLAGNNGSIQTSLFTISSPDEIAPTITVNPNGGIFTSSQSVTFTSDEQATVYYTTDGSTPTENSVAYVSPINIAQSTTLRFFGKDVSGNLSSVQTVSFTINTPDIISPEPVTSLTLESATANSITANWTLSSSPDVANQEIAYSTDGNVFTVISAVVSPNANSYLINGLQPNTLYTIRVITIDSSGNLSTSTTAQATTANLAPTGGGYYLELSGTNSYIEIPSQNFDEIEINFNPYQIASGVFTSYFDAPDISNTWSNRTSNIDTFGTNISSLSVNNINVITTGAANKYLTAFKNKAIIKLVSGGVSSLIIGATSTLTGFAKMKVYGITLRLSGNVVSNYEFSQNSGNTVNDTSGNDNHAIITNGSWIAVPTGVVSAGLLLNLQSPSNNATIPNPNLYFNSTDLFTFAITVKAPSDAKLVSRFTSNGSDNSNNRFNIRKSSTRSLLVDFYGSQSGTPVNKNIAAQPLTDEDYYHLVIKRSNMVGGILTLYINGSRSIQIGFANDISLNSTTLPFIIGDISKTVDIKNIVYYNRVLSEDEIEQNYRALK